jgi:hypothetical protein
MGRGEPSIVLRPLDRFELSLRPLIPRGPSAWGEIVPTMVDLGLILEALSGASTIAVILGIPFIVLQMRQNARMVESAIRQTELVALQNRSQVLLSIAERMTHHDFILQRKAVRDIVGKYSQQGWESFVDSVDGFEVRAFIIQYEATAMMVKFGLIDETTLIETLGFTIVVDWIALGPAIAAFEKEWGRLTFPHFRNLATRSGAYWKAQGGMGPNYDKLFRDAGFPAT